MERHEPAFWIFFCLQKKKEMFDQRLSDFQENFVTLE